MIILEKDFKIECGECYTLSLLKSKKELKEDKEDSYRIGGYFHKLENAIDSVVEFRTHKKYPFKEDADVLKPLSKFQRESDNKLHRLFLSIDMPIRKFSEEMIKKIRDGLV